MSSIILAFDKKEKEKKKVYLQKERETSNTKGSACMVECQDKKKIKSEVTKLHCGHAKRR